MRTLIILGHPDKKSFSGALADEYEKGAKEKNGDIVRINLYDLQFNISKRPSEKLEVDLVEAQRLIKWANHLVFIFPIWWGAPPALMKGFLDRTFLPGFAFKYHEGQVLGHDKLLKGKSARIIVTSDSPAWWLYFNFLHPAINMMKRSVLDFCGVAPVEVTSFGSLNQKNQKAKETLLYKTYRLGLDEN